MVKSTANHGSWLISSGLLYTVLVLLCAVAVMARVGPFDCIQAPSVLCLSLSPPHFVKVHFIFICYPPILDLRVRRILYV